MRGWITTCVIYAQVFSTAVAAEQIQVLRPTTPWNIDYSDDSCALRRTFSSGTNEVFLEMRQFGPGTAFSTMIATRDPSFRTKTPSVRFNPQGALRKIERPLFLIFRKDMNAVSWQDSLFPEDLSNGTAESEKTTRPIRSEAQFKDRESTVQGLEIAGTFSNPISLATGEMHKPMQAMRQCLDELITHWGIDAVAHRTLTRNARPIDQVRWARKIQENYPVEMLRRGLSGLVRVRMMVDTAGRPTSCHIQLKSAPPEFEKTACQELMKAAKFEPALNANGKPIASYLVTSVIYMTN